MSLTVLVVPKLIFPGYFLTHGSNACTIEYVSIRGVLLRDFLIVALSYLFSKATVLLFVSSFLHVIVHIFSIRY